MERMRWFGVAAAIGLLAGAAGCGGAAAAPKSPEGVAPAEAATPPAAEAPAQPEQPGMAMDMEAPAVGGAAPAAQGAPSPAPPPRAPAARSEGASQAEKAPSRDAPKAAEPADRPGLGTQWGETRVSRISTVPFVRADPQQPFSLASLFYNDAEGARAMASAAGFRRTAAQAFTMAGGVVAIGLRGEGGGFLSGFVAGEKSYAVGEAGQRYSIVLRNLTASRIECVVSVDGLDVLDGQPAAFSKRGYLVDPHGELEIDGFRQSTETVAAFRFGSVRGSYANQKHGETRNVGVIGVALFHERGTAPPNQQQMQFATPP
jgi:hypothetical protein